MREYGDIVYRSPGGVIGWLERSNDILRRELREHEDVLRELVNERVPPVLCSGFDTIGPPCDTCPNDAHCPVLLPLTRAKLLVAEPCLIA